MHEIQDEITRHGNHTSTLLVTLCWSVNSRTINIRPQQCEWPYVITFVDDNCTVTLQKESYTEV